MYCPKCGMKNEEGATVCAGCNQVLVIKTQRLSGLAVASMVLGIGAISSIGMFGIFGLPAIVGLVLGIVALRKIKRSAGLLQGRGFAIAGITTSAAGLLLVCFLFGMIFFSLRNVHGISD